MAVDEQLTSRWGNNVAVGDTLLRRYLTHHAALDAAFTLAAGGRALDADDVSMADLGRPGGLFNSAVLLAPPAHWDDVLGRIGCFFRCGRGQARLWSAWPTPDLHDDGWRFSGHPPLLIRPPAATNPIASPTSEPEVRSVATVEDLARWERVVIDGSPLPELKDAPAGGLAPPALLDDERLRFLVGLDGDRPVAAAVSFTSHGIGSLSYDITLPTVRPHGYSRSLAIERVRATPDVWMTGVFSDVRRPDAETLGFVPLLRLTQWILDRP